MAPAAHRMLGPFIGAMCALALLLPTTAAAAAPLEVAPLEVAPLEVAPLDAAPVAIGPIAVGERMAEYLSTHPGGTPINSNEISYSDGALIITLAPPPQIKVLLPDCPLGWFCFYDRTGYGYPRGRLSDCGWQDLATWAWQHRIESVHYNMSRGTATYYYGSTAIFRVSAAQRTFADVRPYRNWAERVRRDC